MAERRPHDGVERAAEEFTAQCGAGASAGVRDADHGVCAGERHAPRRHGATCHYLQQRAGYLVCNIIIISNNLHMAI